MKRSNVWSYTVWLGLVFGVYFGVSQEISHDGVPQYPVGTHEQSAASITDAATAFTSYEVGTAVVARLTITEGVATGAQAVAGSAYTLGTNAVARLVIAEPVLATALQPDGIGTNLILSITPAVVDTNTVIVSGAGSAPVNGTYVWDAACYTNATSGLGIIYAAGAWELGSSLMDSYYIVMGDSVVDTNWYAFGLGADPAPTVSYFTSPAVTNRTPTVLAEKLDTNAVPSIPYVSITATGVDTNTIVVSGAGTAAANGTYVWTEGNVFQDGPAYSNTTTEMFLFLGAETNWVIANLGGQHYANADASPTNASYVAVMGQAPVPTVAYLSLYATNTYALTGLVGHKYTVTATSTNAIAYAAPTGYEIMSGRAWNTTTTNALTFTAGESTAATISGAVTSNDVVRCFIVLRKED